MPHLAAAQQAVEQTTWWPGTCTKLWEPINVLYREEWKTLVSMANCHNNGVSCKNIPRTLKLLYIKCFYSAHQQHQQSQLSFHVLALQCSVQARYVIFFNLFIIVFIIYFPPSLLTLSKLCLFMPIGNSQPGFLVISSLLS